MKHMLQNQGTKEKLKPLEITCTSSDCESGLHCFRQIQKMMVADRRGLCRSCDAKLVDWSRIYKRDVADTSYTFAALRRPQGAGDVADL